MRRIDAHHRMMLHAARSAQRFEFVDEAGDYR
jgi:hypothetical protein